MRREDHRRGGQDAADSAFHEAFADIIYVGCRLGASGVMQQRFRGEIDELFVTDRGLEPNEIVSLMKNNRLPSDTMLAQGSR